MIRGSLLVLLATLLPFCNAFSLRSPGDNSPMVQHISLSLPTATTTFTEQRMTATTAGVVNGAPPVSSTLNPIQSALVKVRYHDTPKMRLDSVSLSLV
jgi:hypothetical protein